MWLLIGRLSYQGPAGTRWPWTRELMSPGGQRWGPDGMPQCPADVRYRQQSWTVKMWT